MGTDDNPIHQSQSIAINTLAFNSAPEIHIHLIVQSTQIVQSQMKINARLPVDKYVPDFDHNSILNFINRPAALSDSSVRPLNIFVEIPNTHYTQTGISKESFTDSVSTLVLHAALSGPKKKSFFAN